MVGEKRNRNRERTQESPAGTAWAAEKCGYRLEEGSGIRASPAECLELGADWDRSSEVGAGTDSAGRGTTSRLAGLCKDLGCFRRKPEAAPGRPDLAFLSLLVSCLFLVS